MGTKTIVLLFSSEVVKCFPNSTRLPQAVLNVELHRRYVTFCIFLDKFVTTDQ